jgi:hypothetical protein
MDADPVGRYRAEDARPTDGVVRATDGVVVGTPLMDADPVGRDKAEDALPTDLEGEQTYVRKARRGVYELMTAASARWSIAYAQLLIAMASHKRMAPTTCGLAGATQDARMMRCPRHAMRIRPFRCLGGRLLDIVRR